MSQQESTVTLLPPLKEVETPLVLRKLASAHRYLAELKGTAATIPNESILINTLALQEAKDSSAIENIITSHDELYKVQLFGDLLKNASAKEVNLYADALKRGFELVRQQKILSNNHILEVQRILENNDAGYRRLPGTKLLNAATKEIVYTPPQDFDTIQQLMHNLIDFINNDEISKIDPLVKMAIMHYQFESIHPFYDGNGRTGRIMNILYLVIKDLLKLPILYLSRYIINNKKNYYRLLQEVREKENWEEWILYMLDGIEQISKETIIIISQIKELMQKYKYVIREKLPKIYSQDLLNNLFRHPYTKIEFVMDDLRVSRITATRYLDLIADLKLLSKQKIGRSNFYINEPLFNLFKSSAGIEDQSETIKIISSK